MNNKVPNSEYIKFMQNKWPFAHHSKTLGQVFIETFKHLQLSEEQKHNLVTADYLSCLLLIANNYIDPLS